MSRSQAFDLAAMVHCADHGHEFAWRRAWHAVGYEECRRCGQTLQVRERDSARTDQPPTAADAAPAAPKTPRVPTVSPRDPRRVWTDRLTNEVLNRAQRDALIVRLHCEEHVPLTVVAERLGDDITPQRAGQICKQAKAW